MVVVFLLAVQLAASPACTDWRDCQAEALQAAARADYETFHDLSWSAVQKGPKNDPDLLFMLARAQSLSGRPDDAVVMLERLARMGADVRAAETSDDFARARAVPRWAEFESLLHAKPAAPAVSAEAAPARRPAAGRRPVARTRSPVRAPAAPEPSKPASSSSAEAPSARPDAATPPASPAPEPAAAPAGEPALTFDAPAADPIGLAYDAVSRRFVVGDRVARRLFIVDEMSHHVVTLAAASTAGFDDQITGFEIDPRRGDLWVVSASSDNHPPSSVLHKLQLVSGRVLFSVAPPPDSGPVRFADVAVTTDGTVMALDGAGARIFRMRAGSRELEAVPVAALRDAVSIAADGDRLAYVAGSNAILRVDLDRRTASALRVEHGAAIRFARLRAYRGSLIGVDARGRVVRLRLDREGRAVVAATVLAGGATPAAALSGDSFYFLSSDAGVIRRVRLRE